MKYANSLKLFLFLIWLFGPSFGLAQKALNQKMSFTFEGITMKDALSQIEQKANLKFAYKNITALNETVTANFQEQPLQEILESLLALKNLSFKKIGKQIAIYESEKKKSKNSPNRSKNEPDLKKEELTFSGYIYDAITGEAIIGANIYDGAYTSSASSNEFGFFSLNLKGTPHKILVSFIGYQTQEFQISASRKLTIKLESAASELIEVEVIASEDEENKILRSPRMSTNKLQSAQIKNIPAIGGEPDLLKALSLLPGIKSGEDGQAGFYVRGGSADQNLILMDGVPLYNAYHLFGFLSTFNADAINNIEVTKGGFPARYGGRLSSVLDVTMKEGNNQEWKTNINVGLLTSKITTSGPIVKDKSSVFFSARRSYVDLLLTPLTTVNNGLENSKFIYNLTDLNLKLNHKISDKDRIFFSSYFSRDLFSQKEEYEYPNSFFDKTKAKLKWRNGIASLRWNHLYSDKLFSNTTLYYTHYSYEFGLSIIRGREGKVSWDESKDLLSKINDVGFKQDFQYYLNQNNTIRFGASIIAHRYDVGADSFKEETGKETLTASTTNNKTSANEFFIYAEDDLTLHPKLKMNIGINANGFLVNQQKYFSLEPRVSLRFSATDRISLKLAYAEMSQNIHLLTSGGLIFKTDFWVPSTENIKPERSRQLSGGTSFKVGEGYLFEIEGYYKTMKNLTEYKPGTSLITHSGSWEDVITTGEGESYGAEFFLQKKKGRLTGWAAYSLSWSYRKFDGINYGERFFDTYDRRHDISLVANYKINKKWSLNGSWVFATGGFTTLSDEGYTTFDYSPEAMNPAFNITAQTATAISNAENPTVLFAADSKNNFRLPNYHRLDITATHLKTTKRGNQAEIRFGLTNVYNQLNASYFRKKQGQVVGSQTEYEAVALFPLMPSFNYSFTF